ncbi:MAG TPA: hypothetical protein VEC12_06165, partial [Bacteroidia bacterium]|nr:hypothetical protein [Bacteroidia bacterium]
SYRAAPCLIFSRSILYFPPATIVQLSKNSRQKYHKGMRLPIESSNLCELLYKAISLWSLAIGNKPS